VGEKERKFHTGQAVDGMMRMTEGESRGEEQMKGSGAGGDEQVKQRQEASQESKQAPSRRAAQATGGAVDDMLINRAQTDSTYIRLE
jgi:hypothetical protein